MMLVASENYAYCCYIIQQSTVYQTTVGQQYQTTGDTTVLHYKELLPNVKMEIYCTALLLPKLCSSGENGDVPNFPYGKQERSSPTLKAVSINES